ncbi:hypothetical protein TSOC_004318 [Tetrabaena socialis]|uniref:Uncharacterized protein n=1 Tax=Tetrabaena socialis TaxID=47790 RepID=A0A2J8A9B7_9CHLO|nr:hypothetical protein TSOC_004318 [Tetrabaena socialis]|eukprot:PNH09100.1 hypothetical protein TSOC_004318 [Tetrabaena socialis]
MQGQEQAECELSSALQHNNSPYSDHGVEVLYRFANFDPFVRAKYFGRSLDLGQFERFRRVMHMPYYATLLDNSGWEVLSRLQVARTCPVLAPSCDTPFPTLPLLMVVLLLLPAPAAAADQVADDLWCARVVVHDTHRLEERTYSITLQQRLGGHYDG